MPGGYLESVKRQYEELPYPPRDPADEAKRTIQTIGDNLLVMNHFCFRGRKDFSSGFRCLVAGGGTGDATIYLAEQLRNFDAEVVYLDLSEASRAIAEERARRRDLRNIRWITGSILDIPELGLGRFDYVSCSGVLHHLASPEDGLAALNATLQDDGAMFLMLYGEYARREVYDMQALLRDYLPPDIGVAEKIAMTRALLAALPESNSFRRNLAVWEWEISPGGFGDAGLYDLLLHSQDRCFNVDQVYELAGTAGLRVAGFPLHSWRYDPGTMATSPEVGAYLATLDLRQRQALAEMMACAIRTHEFYLTRQENTAATLNDEDNALMLFWGLFGKHEELARQMEPGKAFTYQDGERALTITGSEITRALIAKMDGTAPIREICRQVTQAVPGASPEGVRQELRRLFDFLHPQGYLYLLESGSHGMKMPNYRRFWGP